MPARNQPLLEPIQSSSGVHSQSTTCARGARLHEPREREPDGDPAEHRARAGGHAERRRADTRAERDEVEISGAPHGKGR